MEGIQTIQALKAVQSSLPAQTTIPSDELVMLYAADGTPIAKIARDDLVKAVASVMASNSQTTFSKLLGVQANGTPMGIGASDLASVLGGEERNNYIVVDLAGVAITNNRDNAGYYASVNISSSLPQGKIPYAVMWDNVRMQGGVSMNLTPAEIILCSPVAITLPSSADRKARVYYR